MKARIAIAFAAALFATSAFAVDLHGYMRSGIGGNSKGSGQVCFSNPGSDYKFRLGNECETYAELQFDQTIYKDKSGVVFNYTAMLGYNTPGDQDYEGIGGAIALRQQFVSATLPQLSNASLWVGKRYYQRHDVHQIDFFYWDTSGPGAGIENVDLGWGKLAVAVLQNDRSNGGKTFWRPDIRVSGIPVNPNGSIEVGAVLGLASETDANKASANAIAGDKFSYWFTVEHTQAGLLGGFNKLAVQYAAGNLAPMNAYPKYALNTSDSHQIRVVEQLVFQPSPQIDGGFVVTYQNVKNRYDPPAGGVDNEAQLWGAGIRPAYHVNDYFKLVLDAGYNYVKPKDGDATNMFKVTLAPTLTPAPGPGGAYFTRPELRAFVTYASWNDTAQAAGVAGGTFGSDKNGLTFGFQAETWF